MNLGGGYGTTKAFISETYLICSVALPEMSMDEYKVALVQLSLAGEVELARADFAPLMDQLMVRTSETTYLSGSFHFVVV